LLKDSNLKKYFKINISFRINCKQKQYTLTRQAPASMAPRHSGELHLAEMPTSQHTFRQGKQTRGHSTVDLLIKVVCFVKE
jgi:hypothetical protein